MIVRKLIGYTILGSLAVGMLGGMVYFTSLLFTFSSLVGVSAVLGLVVYADKLIAP